MMMAGKRGSQRNLLPNSRFSGPMPWVIAIMMFLTVLAAAAGLGLRQASAHLRGSMAGRITVQLVEADAVERERQAAAALQELRKLAGVRNVRRISDAELTSLLSPWLGASLAHGELPMPVMIDADLAPDRPYPASLVRDAILAVAPSARVEDHGQWLGPLDALLSLLKWLALALVLLMALATSFTVVLATRATLDTHQDTIGVMHLLGATDSQIAKLFQRAMATDAIVGGMLGFALAALLVILLGRRMELVGSELVGSISIPASGWALLILLPSIGTLFAVATARFTIFRTLGRIL